MATYTFFSNPQSRAQIVRWALHEVAADYAQELVEYGPPEAKPEAFRAANPMLKVPTLVHHHGAHEHVVTECAAICHYLAEMHPEAGLLPREEEKADYFRYLFFAAGPVEQAVTANSMGWSVDDPQKQGMLGFGNYDKTMDAFETLLSDRQFVCGDRFTMADVYVGAHVDWGLSFKSIPTRPAFEDYAARIRQRPAYQEAKAIDMELIAEHGDG